MSEPRRLGRYELGERLGIGAMGSVYRARDESLGRDVAVKLVRTAGRSDFQLEVFAERFDHEGRALASLSHPNVVNVFDAGVDRSSGGETPYLVMELVSGRTLAERIAEAPLAPGEVAALGRQLAGALEAAHARSIIHRDVKPANVLEAAPGHWKLADFGIARVPDSSLTLTGQFLGTPAYAAPEVFERGEFGPPSDVYSLGATLYQALAGEPPYGTGGLLGAGMLASDAAPPPSIPGAPPALAAAIAGALERDPARRLTAARLVAILGGAREAPPRRAALIGVAAAMLIVGIALGVGLGSGDSAPAQAPGPISAPALEPPPRPELDERDRAKIAREWRKVDKELDHGKPDKALKHLDKILERDPGDAEARRLFRELAGYEWDGR